MFTSLVPGAGTLGSGRLRQPRLGNNLSIYIVLTYMATLEQLESGGILHRYDADLSHFEMPERCITHTPDFWTWFETVLKQRPKKRGRDLSPYEQVEQIFYDFIIGRPMAYSVDYRKLEPIPQNTWELKTLDVRVFGWLTRKRHFLAVCGDLKDNLTSAKLYKPHIKAVTDFRTALNLDDPKAVTGVSANDVL
jgi:hypothetical protein